MANTGKSEMRNKPAHHCTAYIADGDQFGFMLYLDFI